MSTDTLAIHRLTATAHAATPGAAPAVLRRVVSLQRRLADTHLARAWAEVDLPAGHWCVRRLDVPLTLDLTLDDATLVRAWARALTAGLRRAIRQGSPEVVHYRQELDALTDAVALLACGNTDRAWAWSRMGLLPPQQARPGASPSAALREILLRYPQLAIPALERAAPRCGLAAVHRALDDDGWARLAVAVWRAHGGTGDPPITGDLPPGLGNTPARPTPAWTSAYVEGELTRAILRSRIVPGRRTLDAWAVLVAVGCDPVLPRRPHAAAVLDAVRQALRGRLPGARSHERLQGRGVESTGASPTVLEPMTQDATRGQPGVPDRCPAHPLEQGALLDAVRQALRGRLPGARSHERLQGRGVESTGASPTVLEPMTQDATRGQPGVPDRCPAHPLEQGALQGTVEPYGPDFAPPSAAAPPDDDGPTATASRSESGFPGSDRPETGRRTPAVPESAFPRTGAPACDATTTGEVEPGAHGEPAASEVMPRPGMPRPGMPATAAVTLSRRAASPTRHVPVPEEVAAQGAAGLATEWAGLPFLLATAEAAGLPDRLIDDPELAARPLPWCVHAVGRAITGADGADPSLLALAGLSAAGAGEIEAAPGARQAEQTAIELVARDWSAATVARLAAASSGSGTDAFDALAAAADEVVLGVVRKPGRVVAEPGWIEIHLPLDGVDLAVRRAGLDVDPGWVGWLGTVVRFVYE